LVLPDGKVIVTVWMNYLNLAGHQGHGLVSAGAENLLGVFSPVSSSASGIVKHVRAD
jgi:hypothetical protein